MKLLSIGAAALLMSSASLVNAADLGGNCCADLEERVAELEATTARKGNRKVSLEVSGHVNQAILLWDGFGDVGDDLDETSIINNSNSTSRIRFRGSAKISSDWSAGFLMEFGSGDIANSGGPSIRHQALYIKSNQIGTVWLGRTSEATDGIMELSLASADASTLGSLAPFDAFVEDQTGLGIINPFDGSRKNVLKYITPTLGGFSFSAAWAGEEGNWDAALRYAGEFGAMRVVAGAGYRQEDISTINAPTLNREFWGGSASVMHMPSGLFLDGQYGVSDGLQSVNFTLPVIGVTLPIGVADVKLTTYGLRGGFARNFNGMGTTTIYGEWSRLDIKDVDVDPQLWGLGLVQEIDAAAMSIYVSYRHIDLDLGSDDSADVFVVGSKIKF